ncbi:hypothetical protein D3C81_2109000 [compost metagenome]
MILDVLLVFIGPFLRTGQISRDPAFSAVVVVATFGNKDVTALIHGVHARAFVARITQ